MSTVWQWIKDFITIIFRLILHIIVMAGPWVLLIGLLWWLFSWLAFSAPLALAIGIACIIFILVCKFSGKLIPMTGCNLKTNWVLKDFCVVTTCTSTKCFEVPGPYPAILGTAAFMTQAIWCFCPAALGIPPQKETFFQKLLDAAYGLKSDSELRKMITDIERELTITPKDIDPELLKKLYRVIQKIQNHEPLTQEDYDAMSELFK